MPREARQTANEWLPAELLPAEPASLREGDVDAGWLPVAAPEPARHEEPARLEEAPVAAPEPLESEGRPPELSPPEQSSRLEQPSWPGLVLDLNRATFDQLCRVGLSFHQAAGLIGRREQQGGYFTLDDLEELDGVYGLHRDQIEALKQAARA